MHDGRFEAITLKPAAIYRNIMTLFDQKSWYIFFYRQGFSPEAKAAGLQIFTYKHSRSFQITTCMNYRSNNSIISARGNIHVNVLMLHWIPKFIRLILPEKDTHRAAVIAAVKKKCLLTVSPWMPDYRWFCGLITSVCRDLTGTGFCPLRACVSSKCDKCSAPRASSRPQLNRRCRLQQPRLDDRLRLRTSHLYVILLFISDCNKPAEMKITYCVDIRAIPLG